MGAWGTGNFENDDALDWLAQLEADGLAAVEEAIARALAGAEGYLEAPECCAALAASEVVAALRGHPADQLPQELTAWLAHASARPTADLAGQARAAVEAVRAGSELRELWEESGEFGDWERAVTDLAQRLG